MNQNSRIDRIKATNPITSTNPNMSESEFTEFENSQNKSNKLSESGFSEFKN